MNCFDKISKTDLLFSLCILCLVASQIHTIIGDALWNFWWQVNTCFHKGTLSVFQKCQWLWLCIHPSQMAIRL